MTDSLSIFTAHLFPIRSASLLNFASYNGSHVSQEHQLTIDNSERIAVVAVPEKLKATTKSFHQLNEAFEVSMSANIENPNMAYEATRNQIQPHIPGPGR